MRSQTFSLGSEHLGLYGKPNDLSKGRFALLEYEAKPGNEPPPHLHEFENQTLYILEGEIEAYQTAIPHSRARGRF